MEKIQVIFENDYIHHEMLAFCDSENKSEILGRMSKGLSTACGFYSDNKLLFCAAFDFHEDCVHVNLVGGSFGRHYNALETVATGLAMYLGVDFISLKTTRKAVEKWAVKQGFYFHEATDEYMKVIN